MIEPRGGDGKLVSPEVAHKLWRFTRETVFTRMIDNFQSYVVEIIADAFDLNPNMIINHKIDGSLAFNFSDIHELRVAVIEQMATKYSYLNVVDLDADLRSRFGFYLLEHKITKLRLKRLIEIRNLIVHNRSKINRKFIDAVGSKSDFYGDLVRLGNTRAIDEYLINLAADIDGRAQKQFKLRKAIDG
ncbi:MAG: hypothetical protein RL481_1220 [Pseudomonadota bacterium]